MWDEDYEDGVDRRSQGVDGKVAWSSIIRALERVFAYDSNIGKPRKHTTRPWQRLWAHCSQSTPPKLKVPLHKPKEYARVCKPISYQPAYRTRTHREKICITQAAPNLVSWDWTIVSQCPVLTLRKQKTKKVYWLIQSWNSVAETCFSKGL